MAWTRRLVEVPSVSAPDTAGDREATFARLFEEYATPIYNYALRMVGDPDRAADISQDTFIKAYRKLDQLTDDASA